MCSFGWVGEPRPGAGLTLRRLTVWLAEPHLQLRWLAAIAELVNTLDGGALVRFHFFNLRRECWPGLEYGADDNANPKMHLQSS